MNQKPKFYLTTPIYYVNARPHLGHAYTTIVADTIARYKRMRGFDVVMLTGTDEHGQKIERSAKAAGKSPQQLADEVSAEYRRLWDELDIRYDRFIRTTEDRHEHSVRNLMMKARDLRGPDGQPCIYKGVYEGQYCVHDEMYVDEPLEGGLCPECKRPTERIREENYYFRLSAFQQRLLAHYEQNPQFVQPDTRRNEVMAFVSAGLRDLSISRTTIKWGIPWPDDEKHVFYVWYDALTSYMSGVGYGDDELQWEKWWPADLHLIGKEILRFHAVYWPAFLMAADEPLPKQVFAHGWWLFDYEKMSKSRGNIALPQPIARVLGIDGLRYFLLREMVFGQDGNFSHDALVTRYNSDLANGLGNLASRTLAMIQNYFGGTIPSYEPLSHDEAQHFALPPDTELVGPPIAGYPPAPRLRDEQIKFRADAIREEVLAFYDRYEFSRALERVWELIAEVDKYLVIEAPWKVAEVDERRKHLANILYTAAEALRIVTALAHPVLPHATEKIWRQLGQFRRLSELQLDDLAWGELKAGTAIGEPEAIFPRVKKEEAIERMEAMEQEMRNPPAAAAATPNAAQAEAPKDDKIGIEDFTKVEMRVGEVKSAERVANADKLLKVLVDIGTEVRQVVAGIAEFYEPEKLIGRKVVVVTNLAPRKLRGVESNGMIVAASVPPDGKPVLAGFLEEVPIGARLK
ncbi:MAG: methionine--tRNA ligase [Candidatus Acidiferrales bacterium]